MGANPEHKIHLPAGHSDQVHWINREAAPHEPFVAGTPSLPADTEGGSRSGG